MKENYCKNCIHLFVKSIKDFISVEYGCKLEKEVITTIQEPLFPWVAKPKYFARPLEPKCSCKVRKKKEDQENAKLRTKI